MLQNVPGPCQCRPRLPVSLGSGTIGRFPRLRYGEKRILSRNPTGLWGLLLEVHCLVREFLRNIQSGRELGLDNNCHHPSLLRNFWPLELPLRPARHSKLQRAACGDCAKDRWQSPPRAQPLSRNARPPCCPAPHHPSVQFG